jgi:hypothetical protein
MMVGLGYRRTEKVQSLLRSWFYLLNFSAEPATESFKELRGS